MKRIKNITLHLTEEEAELLERLAELDQRKPSEMSRILLVAAALDKWGQIQAQEHPSDLIPVRTRNKLVIDY